MRVWAVNQKLRLLLRSLQRSPQLDTSGGNRVFTYQVSEFRASELVLPLFV